MKVQFLKKKKYFIRRLISSIFVLIFFILAFRAINGRMYKDYKTDFATLKTYEKKVPVIGFNILNEKVYTAKNSGICVYNASEGEKVPVGYEIASLNMMDDTSDLNDELIKVNSALSYKSKNHVEYSSEKSIPSIEKIQNFLKDENFIEAIHSVDGLDLYSNNNLNISELSELINLSVDELKDKKEKLQNKISESNYTYSADFSSIVSFKIDGLEKYYTIEDLSEYTYGYLNSHKNISRFKTKVEVNKGDNLYKLINNLNYKIALQVDDIKKLDSKEIGDNLKFRNEDISLEGKISMINKSKNGAVVIVDMSQNFYNVYQDRIKPYDIILQNEDCLEIPKSAIIKRKGEFGVFVQEIHGLVKFVPIKVVVPFEDYSYISTGDKNSVIKLKDKSVKTVTLNDKIVLNPKQVEESKILN
ncbi:MAG: HlyD family efflux transporter periplasmic adaptor subunit [Peptoniphilus sp.]|uniref:HlyD family efflux transporter periplasmic adaptor subunit n=1 Tax=Peptoniphilus sp. TaxID=1971214 RepID=UPI002A74D8AD|nr:HlyD family efflux transporter periplasmic adaptor subunit [Peptoniphilus sp.]MDY2986975.1 HlyD family efflux transporter periplasmic adaptor subunit [Peptoniphilus sp.]